MGIPKNLHSTLEVESDDSLLYSVHSIKDFGIPYKSSQPCCAVTVLFSDNSPETIYRLLWSIDKFVNVVVIVVLVIDSFPQRFSFKPSASDPPNDCLPFVVR